MSTVGSITSLQAAVALNLKKGLGFDVNSDFTSNVLTYTNLTLTQLGGRVAVNVALGTANVSAGNVFYTGRFGGHIGTTTVQNLGADTIPAITQTIPSSIVSENFTGNGAGNIVYQFDAACSRSVGSNTSFNLGYFVTTFNLVYGYTVLNNRYVAAATNSNATTFSNCGVTNYQGLVTQGWDKYQTGNAMVKMFDTIGRMTDAISTGRFGTPNAVAQVLLQRGLGTVGDLSKKLTAANINIYDLLDTRYDDAISKVLTNFTNADNLNTIQDSMDSTIVNMTSLNDYTSIEKCANQSNDSVFATMAEVGLDLYKKSNNPSFQFGSDIANLIRSISKPHSDSIESLSGTNGSLLSADISNELKSYLATSRTGGNISMLNLIGTSSGYYNTELSLVVDGLNRLSNSSYGSQITTALQDIIDTLNDAEQVAAGGGLYTPGPPYYGIVDDAVAAYNNLMNTIVNDASVHAIVNQINSNYSNVCLYVAEEYKNWNKANFFTGSYNDSITLLTFAQSIPQFGQDSQGTGSGIYLSGMAANDSYGSTIKSVLIEGQNYQKLLEYGIQPNGYVG